MKKSSGRPAGHQLEGREPGGHRLRSDPLKAPALRADPLRVDPVKGDPVKGDPLKAMSPGVVDFLFRQLVAGEPAEDIQWGREGVALSDQAPGAELARRLSETDIDALTPTELFHYVRAAQRLTLWAESLRELAVERYCSGADPA
ncbi:hypothetical protein ARGLB_016_00620 [Arthrobacter globiformis NBRC 12137]|uniref:Uncharacterized protein n=1 Tax=Arthrobacter globiformis (strain ATCC 8010 / DSM 20124 / JCM 1332 / NBRC 12137 / NCIMB 8907 / NRRL B-2979 / 168) TaxID=1077972 RepID=H0QI99_ARTG1|nr:hypothetical protein [Arthrobacter globiformis]GAB12550.1 hypothetical protein ARGLB_016_00620 [Arthrobacter globiformis NBRC 12137]